MADVTASAFDYVFPVIGYERGSSGNFDAHQVYGTAFSIGKDLYLTAGHALAEALKHPGVAIGRQVGDQMGANPVQDYEIARHCDIAVFRAQVGAPRAMPWRTAELPMLASVRAVGFPYALDSQRAAIHIRARRGEIVTSRTFDLLPAAPRVYELSFACPRGMSGAPLLWEAGPDMGLVSGVICRNVSTEMVVYGEEERLMDEGRERTDSRREFSVWGLALQADPVLKQTFPVTLKMTLGAWLQEQGLIAK